MINDTKIYLFLTNNYIRTGNNHFRNAPLSDHADIQTVIIARVAYVDDKKFVI